MYVNSANSLFIYFFLKKNTYCLLHTSAIDVWLTKEREQLGDLICLHSTQLCGYKKSNNNNNDDDGGGCYCCCCYALSIIKERVTNKLHTLIISQTASIVICEKQLLLFIYLIFDLINLLLLFMSIYYNIAMMIPFSPSTPNFDRPNFLQSVLCCCCLSLLIN